uniref:VWFA domain-containing protein n=1 Tax=viral metagenome TaxID=1070528 RepID=A0A6C0CWE6_9ZZZZ
MSQPIKNAYLQFQADPSTTHEIYDEESNTPLLFELFPNPNPYTFGTLQIQMNETSQITNPLFILFSIDRSQSMDDICPTDHKTKMDHAKHTTKKMLEILLKKTYHYPPQTIYVQLVVFDDETTEIIPKTLLDSTTITQINTSIDSIEPQNSTNLELALTKSREIMEKEELLAENENENEKNKSKSYMKTEIFLTDGNATSGIKNVRRLTELSLYSPPREDNDEHIYIGYGDDHNANLLQTLAQSRNNASYYFLDQIENSNLLFGEILHGILYPALKNTTINTNNCEIYDYKTNTWSNTLKVGPLLSESFKTYHVRTTTPQEQITATICAEQITATICAEQITGTICTEKITTQDTPFIYQVEVLPDPTQQDLTKYMFRQKVQEYLYLSKHISNYIDESSKQMIIIPKEERKRQNDRINAVKNDMKLFMKYLKCYMKTNYLEHDKFHQTLYEDLYISYKTFATLKGAMYSGARQHSQGRQTSYIISTPQENQDHLYNINVPTSQRSRTPSPDNSPISYRHLSENTTPTQRRIISEMTSFPTRSRTPSPPLAPSDMTQQDFEPLTELDKIIFNKITTKSPPREEI